MKQSSYQDLDVNFGQTMLTLRTNIGLTQVSLAQYLGLSRQSIASWESGKNYPKAKHLKQFIGLALEQQAFNPGREAEDIKELWQASHQKMQLDKTWLTKLLNSVKVAPSSQKNTVIELSLVPSPTPQVQGERGPRVDWGEALSIPNFYGRQEELSELRKWVIEEECRVVSVLGMGGMGKSALSITLMHQLSEHFEVVLWRSLRDAPECETLLDSCLQVLAPEMINESSSSLEQRLKLLLNQLQSRRVLLVLDNMEAILAEGPTTGYMRKGYEAYGRLLRLIAETTHHSCLLLTSREKPVELVPLEGKRAPAPVRSLRLNQLDEQASEQLLLEKGVTGSPAEKARLSEIFTGNPLALKIVAQNIIDLFGGEIAAFLAEGEAIFGGIRKLLEGQFARLSPLEQTILLWLAVLREATRLDELLALLVISTPRMRLLEALESLHRRSLIERGVSPGSFTLQSVVLEYLTTRLVAEVAEELQQGRAVRLVQHSLVQALAKDYVRKSQERVIIQPLLTQFKGPYNDVQRIESYLNQILEQLQKLPKDQQGYGGGNILNLLVALEVNLRGRDFSGLNLWQAYLAGIEMHEVNLAGCDLSHTVFTQGFKPIYTLAYSPDGRFLAGGGYDKDITIWQLNEGISNIDYSLYMKFGNYNKQILSLAYSPDGKLLASGSYDYEIRLWDSLKGQLLIVLEGHTAAVSSVVFSPDGKLLASGSIDCTVRLWKVATGKLVKTFEGHTGWIRSVAFSPNGQLVASGSHDNTIRLWQTDLAADLYQPTAILSEHKDMVTRVAFSSDGKTLFSCGADATLRVWEVASHKQIQVLEGSIGSDHGLAVSPDGLVLASSGFDRIIRLWQLNNNKIQLHRTLVGHAGAISTLAFNSDNTILASSSADLSVRLWSVEKGEGLATLQGYQLLTLSIAISPDGTYFTSSAISNRILLYQLSQQQLSQTQPLTPSLALKGHTEEVWTVVFSSDGEQLACAGKGETIRLWSIANFNESRQVRLRRTLSGHTDSINAIAFNPMGNLLASGSHDGTVRVWSTSNGKLIMTLEGHQGFVRTVAFSPNGSVIASGGNDGTLRIWDIQSGQLTATLSSDGIPIVDLAYHPNGQFLAWARFDGIIQVWQTNKSNQPPLVLKGHRGTVWSLAFNPAPDLLYMLVSGGLDGIVRLWDSSQGKELACFQNQRLVRSVAFTPDGKRVLSAGEGGLIKMWDIAKGELVAAYRDFLPYEGINISGASGLTMASRATLLSLGAVES